MKYAFHHHCITRSQRHDPSLGRRGHKGTTRYFLMKSAWKSGAAPSPSVCRTLTKIKTPEEAEAAAQPKSAQSNKDENTPAHHRVFPVQVGTEFGAIHRPSVGVRRLARAVRPSNHVSIYNCQAVSRGAQK